MNRAPDRLIPVGAYLAPFAILGYGLWFIAAYLIAGVIL